jgi:predicted chitinase
MKEETILGAGDGVESELIALYDAQAPVTNDNSPVTKTQVLGKLSVVTYDEIVKDLVIVPINGNKYPYNEGALRTQLNKIYGQAVVKWNITFAQNFDVPGIDPFDDGGSGLLSNYSPDMRKVVSAYKANVQRNTFYLFLVKNPKSGTDGTVSMAGFMPRSKSVGFIFLDKNGSEAAMARTIAHELGHGAFQLRHTFADEINTLPKGTTTNLMDYVPAEQAGADGTKLYKYQWDRVRYREIVIGLFEDDEDGAMVATGGTFSTHICDSTLKDKGVYYLPTTGSCKLFAQFDIKDASTIKEAKVKLTIAMSGSKNKITKDYTIKLNEKIELQVDSLPDGKYTLNCTAGKQSVDKTFYLRKKKYDFACSVCGRDLLLTLAKLNLIFPGNKKLTKTHVDYLNDALKKGDFTTCKRNAHFFSQVYIESGNFKDFEEDYMYRLYGHNSNNDEIGIYATFGTQDNDSYKTLYSQSFWNNNEHLDYTGSSKCSHLYQKKDTCTDIKDKSKRYVAVEKVTKTRKGYTITFPENFKKDTTGTYIKYTITDAKKCGENLFNLVYKDKNGNTLAGDGWKYRGRGAIQVTGRENYRKTSDKCNNTFSKNFSWENNPDQLNTDPESIIYSAVAWFLNAFNPISSLDDKTADQVTKKVNAKQIDKEGRSKKYNELMNDSQLYNCELK